MDKPPLQTLVLDWRSLSAWSPEKTVEAPRLLQPRLLQISSKFHLVSLVALRFGCMAREERGLSTVTSQSAASMI